MKGYLRAGAWVGLKIVAGALILLAVTGGFCLLGRQCTVVAYGSAAQNLGLVVFGLGGISVAGAALSGRNSNYQIARTVSADNTLERTRRDVQDSTRRLMFTVVTTGSGAISLLVGLWLWLHFR